MATYGHEGGGAFNEDQRGGHSESVPQCKCGKPAYRHCDMCAPCLIVELLVTEDGLERDNAEELVRSKVDIVVKGLMTGNLRATAIALQMSAG